MYEARGIGGDNLIDRWDWQEELRQRHIAPIRGTQTSTAPTNAPAPICGRNIDSTVVAGTQNGVPIGPNTVTALNLAQNPNYNAAPTFQTAPHNQANNGAFDYIGAGSGAYDVYTNFVIAAPAGNLGIDPPWLDVLRFYKVPTGASFDPHVNPAAAIMDVNARGDGNYQLVRIPGNVAGQAYDIYMAFVDHSGLPSAAVLIGTTSANPIVVQPGNGAPVPSGFSWSAAASAITYSNGGGGTYDSTFNLSLTINNYGTGNPALSTWLYEVGVLVSIAGKNNFSEINVVPPPGGTVINGVTAPGLGAGNAYDVKIRLHSFNSNSYTDSAILFTTQAQYIGPGGALSGSGPNLVVDSNFVHVTGGNPANSTGSNDPYWTFYWIDGASFFIGAGGYQTATGMANYLGVRPGDSSRKCLAQSLPMPVAANQQYGYSGYIDASTCSGANQPLLEVVSTDGSTVYKSIAQTNGQHGIVQDTYTVPASGGPTQVCLRFNSNAATINSSILVFAIPQFQMGVPGPYQAGPDAPITPAPTSPPPTSSPTGDGGTSSGGGGADPTTQPGHYNHGVHSQQTQAVINATAGGDGSYFANSQLVGRHFKGGNTGDTSAMVDSSSNLLFTRHAAAVTGTLQSTLNGASYLKSGVIDDTHIHSVKLDTINDGTNYARAKATELSSGIVTRIGDGGGTNFRTYAHISGAIDTSSRVIGSVYDGTTALSPANFTNAITNTGLVKVANATGALPRANHDSSFINAIDASSRLVGSIYDGTTALTPANFTSVITTSGTVDVSKPKAGVTLPRSAHDSSFVNAIDTSSRLIGSIWDGATAISPGNVTNAITNTGLVKVGNATGILPRTNTHSDFTSTVNAGGGVNFGVAGHTGTLPRTNTDASFTNAIDANSNLLTTHFPGKTKLVNSGTYAGWENLLGAITDTQGYPISSSVGTDWLWAEWFVLNTASVNSASTGTSFGFKDNSGNTITADFYGGGGTQYYNSSAGNSLSANPFWSTTAAVKSAYIRCGITAATGNQSRFVVYANNTKVHDAILNVPFIANTPVFPYMSADTPTTCYIKFYRVSSSAMAQEQHDPTVLLSSVTGAQRNVIPDSDFKFFNAYWGTSTSYWGYNSFWDCATYSRTGTGGNYERLQSSAINVVQNQPYSLSIGVDATSVTGGGILVNLRSSPGGGIIKQIAIAVGSGYQIYTAPNISVGANSQVWLDVECDGVTLTNGSAVLMVKCPQLEPGSVCTAYRPNVLDVATGYIKSGTLKNQGSIIPVGAPGVSISASNSSGNCSVTISWSAGTIYAPDGSSIPISAGSWSQSGLSAGTSYHYSVYADPSGGVHVLGNYGAGTAPNAQQKYQIYLDGRFPITEDCYVTTPSTSGGGYSGGGGGGGGSCPSLDQIVHVKELGHVTAREYRVGMHLMGPDGEWKRILKIAHETSQLFRVTVAGETYEVDTNHYWLGADGEFTKTPNLTMNTMLRSTDGRVLPIDGIVKGEIGTYAKTQVEGGQFVIGRLIGHNAITL